MSDGSAIVVVLGLLLAGCSPASFFSADCEPSCLDELTVRLSTNDVIVRNPGIWRFHDDFARTLPSACGDAGVSIGALKPRWSRTLTALHGASNQDVEGVRSALAVHPRGGVAVAAGGTLWLLEADAGLPTHGLLGGAGGVQFGSGQLAAFTPDGESLWVNAGKPARLDLTSWDKLSGPAAYKVEVGPGWAGKAPAVAADGTLIFLSVDGLARAVEPSGRVRWERPNLAGTPRVDAAGRVFWSQTQPPRALDVVTGEEVWSATVQPEWRTSTLLTSEGAPVRFPIPLRNLSLGSEPHSVSLHREDGSVARLFRPANDAGVSLRPVRAAQSRDGILLLTFRLGEGVERIVALEEATGRERWTRDVAELATDPLPGPSGDLYVATTDCRLAVLDASGEVTRSYVMPGKPTGDLLQLSGGVVYVLTRLATSLAPGERVWADDVRLTSEDGGAARVEDYDCPAGVARLCSTIDGDDGPLLMLHAFQVE